MGGDGDSHFRVQSGSRVCQSLYEPSLEERSVRLRGTFSLAFPATSQ